jgi:hypothetical protein
METPAVTPVIYAPFAAAFRDSLRTVVAWLAAVIVLLTVIVPNPACAEMEHELMRRIVVFPFKGLDVEMAGPRDARSQASEKSLEEGWWQVREELTASRRLLVASKQFLVKSDVYQARAELEPADAILLGRLLDAHALVTGYLKDRVLYLQVYDGSNGMVLWRKHLHMHAALTVSDQLPSTARRLIRDFIASIPYQGFQVVDPLIGKAVYEEGDVKLAQVDVGASPQVQTGDPVQWVRITMNNIAPLFQGGSKTTVFAEGRIVRVEQGVATVEITRATRLEDIKEFSLVRLPREFERLQVEYLLKEKVRSNLGVELLAPEESPMAKVTKEQKPLVTTLSWVSSLVALLLLAF